MRKGVMLADDVSNMDGEPYLPRFQPLKKAQAESAVELVELEHVARGAMPLLVPPKKCAVAQV